LRLFSSDTGHRGISVVQINPFTCTSTAASVFDVYFEGGNPFSSFISNVTNGTVLAATTITNPQENLVDRTLASLGVFASDVPTRGSFTFVAQKGYANKTVFSKTRNVPCNVTAYLSVAITGEFHS
jgi:Interleukin-like EMT inducer